MPNWKAINLFLPDTLSADEVLDHVRGQVRIIATDAGEFVQDFRIDLTHDRDDGWNQWAISYLPGPGSPALKLFTEP